MTRLLATAAAVLALLAPPAAAAARLHQMVVFRSGKARVSQPSLAQATTGAVLRNGYLTHRDPSDGQRLAVDFSSARVRDALAVLDGVREGQPLGALLGYRFERGMHRLHRDVLVQPLRDRFPLYANRLTEPSGPTEAVAANNVVNGLDVHRIWRDGSLFTGDPAKMGDCITARNLLGTWES